MWRTPASEWDSLAKSGLGIFLYKNKGWREDLSNYRVIMLLSVLSRLLARIVAQRLSVWAESSGLLHEFQWGFRPQRRCTDPAMILTLLIEVCNHLRHDDEAGYDRLVLILWDIVKAYPRVQRHFAWRLLHELGIPDEMLSVLHGLHDSTTYQIRSASGLSDEFELAIGFREGCPSSPVLFSLYHNAAISRFVRLQETAGNAGVRLRVNPGGPMHTRAALAKSKRKSQALLQLMAVLFADDTTGICRESLRASFEDNMATALWDYKEELNPSKTHRLQLGASRSDAGFQDAVKFLGVWLQWDGSHERHERALSFSRQTDYGDACARSSRVLVSRCLRTPTL